MPLYTYRCDTCNDTFEKRHAYKATGILCESCGSDKISKILSLAQRSNLDKKNYNNKKVGSEVIKAIEETKKEIDITKSQKSQRIYKKNNKR